MWLLVASDSGQTTKEERRHHGPFTVIIIKIVWGKHISASSTLACIYAAKLQKKYLKRNCLSFMWRVVELWKQDSSSHPSPSHLSLFAQWQPNVVARRRSWIIAIGYKRDKSLSFFTSVTFHSGTERYMKKAQELNFPKTTYKRLSDLKARNFIEISKYSKLFCIVTNSFA